VISVYYESAPGPPRFELFKNVLPLA
jgi:hypothetical protein